VNASFVFDANKCTGCGACRVACTIENGLAPDVSWRRIETFNPQRRAAAPVFHLSIACNHCATAACMNACPALAYHRDAPTGAVLLDSGLCIGCGYCSWACPYDAPVFDESAGVMTKCTWCADRLAAGLKPACATHCPTGALDYASVPPDERRSVMVGLAPTSLQPSLHVIPLAPGRTQPQMTAVGDETDTWPGGGPSQWYAGRGFSPASLNAPAGDGGASAQSPGASAGISLSHEWPLAAFTFGAALLVALVTGAAAGAYRLSPWTFMIAAALVMGVAGAHLGRKDRAWRAVLNVRRSWLSREVALVSLSAALAAAWLLLAPDQAILAWMAALLGFAGLYCADSVYGVLPGGPGFRHSAGVTTTGALLAAALSGTVVIAVPLIALKAWMYFRLNESRRLHPAIGALRVSAGFAAPMVLWSALPSHGGAIACIVIGEAIGRAEYYMQLTRSTPRIELDRVLTEAGLKPRPT
jgi:Fe-S-cluster-containing dehydrogenase component